VLASAPRPHYHALPMSIEWLDIWDQAINRWATSLGWPLEGALRLLLAAAAGGMVGLEREVRGRQAGFRTYLLVCLGSALVMIVSTQFAFHQWQAQAGINITVDPGRIAYGIMTGVGFLGAGTIIHSRGSVRGLTTAAGIWCVAAVGLAVGFGLYLLAIIATMVIVAALWILDYFEDMLPKLRYRTVTLRVKWEIGCIAQTVQRFKDAGLHVVDASFQRSDDLIYADIDLRIAFINSAQYYNFERKLEGDQRYQLIATREL
jgi:putative Mg2+ transporter-C (MgtC) family protein